MKNLELFERAKAHIPSGVNSPVRAFGKVGGTPRFIREAKGPYLIDAEGKRYIDHVLSWGPMILGHSHPEVVEAVSRQAGRGMSFGAPTELEVEMAERLCEAVPSMDKVRLVNSGTEATMSAVRLARAFTSRDLIVKFEGCYHGHVDSLLARAGSGALTFGVPDTSGVPGAIASTTAVLPYNDADALRTFMAAHGSRVAAVIVEPVAGNMNIVLPRKGFLESLREITREHGALLIFDEVITGFRFCYGGYQDMSGIRPDLTCLGKIIGGGMPVGAFGGRADIMSMLAPEGPVYQAGTLAGNPVAVTAGLATLAILKRENPYPALERSLAWLTESMGESARSAGIALKINRLGSMAGLFFSEGSVETFEQVMACDAERYARFFHLMLDQGVYLAPSPFEALFVSTAHTPDVLDAVAEAARTCMARL
ncbi:MAG: glutamate-1-semialdehyde 2,1-aminomutase [Desulfomonilia bacterium]|uniref:glutamate-1-semialdehyde 2,1-aminomutase n=1 Tax=anaerobic digester metagenome TaxID=1263854 RepID=A0A485M3Z6_9ZZZZ|nr:glutamate-1-semialdehyde 2,1-aminomutase [Pseudomonadota bacterium]HON38452.1 glutamate-1-semialdehyde 2,1-aminomutase [Deltaproteobacteria bacterium]HRS54864.1 glutamate-1-semialdehyde 2,1-aminomutase [Desulfomonilia bacterium]HPD20164.1 glutamate-1-semialdehyde 2,1-aminomutase [Deltaproteobacteria bacterium]HPX17950.1 glutamate-1-semialdehyde 2,1-aminomutase [Deltaproteobacteria bacterium]